MNEYLDEDFYIAHNMMLDIDVFARVEGIDDQFFWKDIFRKYAKNYRIEFFPYSKNLNSGKAAVLNSANLKNLGKHFVLCVDSDYDYLVDKSKFNSPFIFHTYTHSIENYKLSPEGLDILLEKLVCPPTAFTIFSFNKFLQKYSTIIYPIFLYILAFNKNGIQETLVSNKNITENLGLKSEDIAYRSTDFSESLKILENNVSKLNKALKEKYPNIDLKEIEAILTDNNIIKSALFWYIRGHLLYDNVISIILPKLKSYYIHKTKEWFNQHSANSDQKTQKKNEYSNKTRHTDWRTLLSDNHMACLSFDCCPPLKNIQRDIEKYMGLTES